MFLFVATNMAIFCKCSKLFREDDVGVLTLSSRAGERTVERAGAGQCLDMSAAFGAELLVDFVLFGHQEVEYIKLED